MKIYRDILDVLRIETVYVVTEESIFMCVPLEISGMRWTVSCDSDFLNGSVTLKVKFNGTFIYLKAVITGKEQDDSCAFIYDVEIDGSERGADNFKFIFFMMLSELEEEHAEWNKRKEERYDIGLDEERVGRMGFKDAEQTLISGKRQLPCVVNNISYSGAKVTTVEGDFRIGKKVGLNLSFVSPIEQIFLTGDIRNCHIKTAGGNVIVSVLSLEFECPPFGYRKRVESFAKKMRKEV